MQNHQNASSTNWWSDFVQDCLHILKASRQAFQLNKLLLAAVGLILTCLLGYLLDSIWQVSGGGISTAQLQSSPLVAKMDCDSSEGGCGVFSAVVQHEKYCLDQALKAGRKLALTDGMGDIWWKLDQGGEPRLKPQAGLGFGVLAFLIAMFKGLNWMVWSHWFFSLLLLVMGLIVWSFCGGAICRISALQFARDERISLREALSFSKQKFWHFLLAPLIPVILVLVIGLIMFLGGLFTRIPLLGSVFGGLFFWLALFGGGLISLILIGAVGGFSLMWPTVAVEGLDCTDSIGRSFSYLFERPERTIVYALLAFFYGALVWLFIRLFAFLVLWGTHGFVSHGYPYLDQMWAAPEIDALYVDSTTQDQLTDYPVRNNFTQPLIKFWVSLFLFFLYGYLVSYYFSGSTIIYYLLRRQVDDTELDDVYVPPTDEEAEQCAPPPPPPPPPTEEPSGSGSDAEPGTSTQKADTEEKNDEES